MGAQLVPPDSSTSGYNDRTSRSWWPGCWRQADFPRGPQTSLDSVPAPQASTREAEEPVEWKPVEAKGPGRGSVLLKVNGPVRSTCRTAETTGAWEIPAPSGCRHLSQLTKVIDSPLALILKIKQDNSIRCQPKPRVAPGARTWDGLSAWKVERKREYPYVTGRSQPGPRGHVVPSPPSRRPDPALCRVQAQVPKHRF